MSYRVASKTDIEKFLKPLIKEDVHRAVDAAVEPLMLKISAMAERIGVQQEQIGSIRSRLAEVENKHRSALIRMERRLKVLGESK